MYDPIGIEYLDYFISSTEPLELLAEKYGFEKKIEEFKSKGLRNIATAMGETATDLAIKAAKKLIEKNDVNPKDISLVIQFSTWHDLDELMIGPVYKIQNKLKLDHALGMTVTHQSCTSYMLAVKTAMAYLKSFENIKCILLVSGDKIVYPYTPRSLMDHTVFGDAGAAMLISRTSNNRILACEVNTVSSHYRHFDYSEVEKKTKQLLFYHGLYGPKVIRKCIRKAELSPDEINIAFCSNVHNDWPLIFETAGISHKLNYSKNISRLGHCNTSDLTINIKDAIDDGSFTKGDYAVLFCMGVGNSWGSMVIQN